VSGYVILEWNQASHQPDLLWTCIYDDEESAKEIARIALADTRRAGRRERYSVHEVGEQVWHDSDDTSN
jgi:hypothetical protein